jgi:hypothetical protein
LKAHHQRKCLKFLEIDYCLKTEIISEYLFQELEYSQVIEKAPKHPRQLVFAFGANDQ